MKTLSFEEASRLRFELQQIGTPDADYDGTQDDALIGALVERGLLIVRDVVYLLPNPDDAEWFDEWSYPRPLVTELGKLALLAYVAVRT